MPHSSSSIGLVLPCPLRLGWRLDNHVVERLWSLGLLRMLLSTSGFNPGLQERLRAGTHLLLLLGHRMGIRGLLIGGPVILTLTPPESLLT